MTAACLDRSRDEDDALTELYEGVLTVQGVRYGWRAAFYTDPDGVIGVHRIVLVVLRPRLSATTDGS